MIHHNDSMTYHNPDGKAGETTSVTPFFTVTDDVTFTLMKTPEKEKVSPPPHVRRLVSLIGLSTALLWPLSGCSDLSTINLPCPVSTAISSGVTNGASTTKCNTNNNHNGNNKNGGGSKHKGHKGG